MKEKILSLLNKESLGVNQAALLLAFFAFLAQILGLVRDRALASIIGPSETLDIYYAAFKIPDLIFISVASLASVVVLLPILAEKIKEKEEARRFFNSIFSTFAAVLILTSAIVFFLMPWLMRFVVPGFSEGAMEKTVNLSRIMLLSQIFLGFSTMFGAVTQFFKKFFLFSLLPVLYNFGILIGVLWFYSIWGTTGLALGVVLGAFMHFVVQWPVLRRLGFWPRINFRINWPEVQKVTFISLPRTLGLALGNITLIILTALASKMATGSISIFNFAIHLQMVPITLIGVSYSMAAFPTLSLLVGDKEKFFRELALAGRQIIFWSIPAIFLFIILRAQIVRVILGAGLFDWEATRLTAAALALFAISITAQSLILLFTRAFYAYQRTFRPFFVNLVSAVVTVVFAFVFIELFKQSDIRLSLEVILRVRDLPETMILALPLAFSLGSILNAVILWQALKRDFTLPGLSLSKTFWQASAGGLVMGLVAYGFLVLFGRVFDLNTFFGIFAQGFISGIFGIAVGGSALWALGNEEIKALTRTLKTKFWKTKVVISEEAHSPNQH